MILDKQEYFLTTLASETLGGYASGVSDYRDLESTGALDGSKKVYLNIDGLTDLTSTAGDTLTINLVSDTAAGFATAKTTHYTTGAIAKADIAGMKKKVLLPEGMYRYSRIEWVVSAVGTPSAGGTFNAYLSNS